MRLTAGSAAEEHVVFMEKATRLSEEAQRAGAPFDRRGHKRVR